MRQSALGQRVWDRVGGDSCCSAGEASIDEVVLDADIMAVSIAENLVDEGASVQIGDASEMASGEAGPIWSGSSSTNDESGDYRDSSESEAVASVRDTAECWWDPYRWVWVRILTKNDGTDVYHDTEHAGGKRRVGNDICARWPTLVARRVRQGRDGRAAWNREGLLGGWGGHLLCHGMASPSVCQSYWRQVFSEAVMVELLAACRWCCSDPPTPGVLGSDCDGGGGSGGSGGGGGGGGGGYKGCQWMHQGRVQHTPPPGVGRGWHAHPLPRLA